jgi:hypothetical protein
MTKYVFWSDAPPLSEGASGCHGVARNIIEAAHEQICLVLTHRFRRKIRPSDIRKSVEGLPAKLYPDCSGTGIRRFSKTIADWIDLLLFLLALPSILLAIRKSGAERILALMGADGWTLLHVVLLHATRLPIDIYLVDDLQESARKNRQPWLATLLKSLEPFCLKRCARVFTICPGFSEHIAHQFGVESRVLYLTAPCPPSPRRPLSAPVGSPRSITFIGALNHLYTSALLELHSWIQSWNNEHPDSPLVLTITTYADPGHFLKLAGTNAGLQVHRNLSDLDMQTLLQSSLACFLPYSFDPEEELMVRTSFSCKMLEYFKCGRPMLVYGPEYASIPRYFSEFGLDFRATTLPELRTAILSLLAEDNHEWEKRYLNAWTRNHSPRALLETLSAGL